MKFLTLIFLALASFCASAEQFQFTPQCYVRFSPKGGATAEIVNRINLAEQEVFVQAYNFASGPIADSIISANRRLTKDGKPLNVILLVDGKQPTANGNKLQYSKTNGVRVALDKKHAISHDKVIIIDQKWIHTGSFNFSANAENRNSENSVWCLDPEMAKIYLDHFNEHLSHSVEF